MGVLDYDRDSWVQSSVFIVASVGYVICGVFVVRQFRTSMKATFQESSKQSLRIYFLCVLIAFSLRILYYYAGEYLIPYPLPLYGLLAFFPGPIMTVACVYYMDYLAKSFYFHFGGTHRCFQYVFKVYLAIFLPILVGLYGGMLYQQYKNPEKEWNVVFFAVFSCFYFLVFGLLIYIIIIYLRQLKAFPFTYNEKKLFIVAMLAVTVIQILYRVANTILNAIQVFQQIEEYSKANNIPISQILIVCYHFICDLLLVTVYTLYLRKDMSHIAICFSLLSLFRNPLPSSF